MLNIGRKQIVSDTILDTLDTGLEETPGFETSPDLDHAKVNVSA